MKRLTTQPRPNWQSIVESQGLHFHTFDGVTYWDESVIYHFEPDEIDAIERATYELDRMCLEAVDVVIRDELWDMFSIPSEYRDWIGSSWENDEYTVVGRFDLAYDGTDSPKMLEYNADTPTGLLEASAIQWYWMQDRADGMDQFNSIHDRLIEAWRRIRAGLGDSIYYFLSTAGHLEDYMNVNYLRDTAMQAGLTTEYIEIESLGFDNASQQFVDMEMRQVATAFKLYPWEWMFNEGFGSNLLVSNTRWLEPPWKVILSNKAIMAVLWKLFPNSPYLLETSIHPLRGSVVQKPRQSREGDGVEISVGGETIAGQRKIDSECIYQRYCRIKTFDGRTPVVGSWMINGHAAGIGIREDDGLITGNDSRFVPHFFG